MANDNHLSSVTLYNVTMINNKYYNEFFELGQQKNNFNFFELSLPDDDPVYTLKKVMEDLDFTNLLAQYSNKGRNGVNPIMKIWQKMYLPMQYKPLMPYKRPMTKEVFLRFYLNFTYLVFLISHKTSKVITVAKKFKHK